MIPRIVKYGNPCPLKYSTSRSNPESATMGGKKNAARMPSPKATYQGKKKGASSARIVSTEEIKK
jgi:hypothetical protein